MTRAVLCGAFLLSISCSSSSPSPAPQGSSGAGGTPSGGGLAGAVAQGGASPGGSGAAGAAGASANAGSGVGGAGTNAGAAGTGVSGTTGVGGSGTAGAGTAGAPPVAGAAGAATMNGGSGPAGVNESITQRGADSARTSHWIEPKLTKASMTRMAPDAAFNTGARFAGEFTSSPLFLAGATPGTGRFYAATTENDVFALDETSGATVWKRNIGGFLDNAPVCLATPVDHGILSTGVIDADAHVLYVAAAMADGHHELHALSLDNMGAEVAGWPFDISTVTAGALAFKPIQGVQNQRSALSLVGGIIYVAFGGYCGDAGAYHGWVVAVDSKNPKSVGAWATMDPRQSGIWASGGLASDGNGVFAITGNAAGVTGTNHAASDSEEILRLTGLAVPHRDNLNLFLPAEWSNPMNASDKDFGSCSPAVITVPNSTPSKVIVAPSKPGHVYFLDAANLGGERGQFAEAVVASTTDQSLYTAPSAYQAASGVYVAITTGIGSQCPNGGGGDGNVMSILMQPGVTPDKPPMPKIAWCSPVNSTDNATHYISPISTNSAGSADPIVWMINGDKLNAFDGETGTVLYNSGTSTCVGVQKFTAPIAVNGRIVTGGSANGQAHLCSWSVH